MNENKRVEHGIVYCASCNEKLCVPPAQEVNGKPYCAECAWECAECGKPFVVTHEDDMFCSPCNELNK